MEDRKLKICILTQNIYTLGGIQKVVTTLVNELVYEEKYEISILMPFEMSGNQICSIDPSVKLYPIEELLGANTLEQRLSGKIQEINAKTGCLDRKFLFPLIYRLRYTNRQRAKLIQFFDRFDVVIGTGFNYSLLLGEMSKQLKCKTIGWQHSTYDSYFERKGLSGYGLKEYAKLQYKQLDGVLVLTKADKKMFDDMMGINSIVFYNPIPKQNVKKTELRNNNILFVGRLDKYHKGLEYLLAIIKDVIIQVPEARITIVGDGPDRQWLTEEIKKAGIEDQVMLVGKTNEVHKYYGETMVLLQTSRFEGFGMTIVEAMSHGIPVVSFHNYGPDEIIEDNVNGFLIDKFDTNTFVDRIVMLLHNEKERKRISDACLERAKDFCVEKTTIQFDEIISDLLRR